MKAISSIKKGEEVLNTYGALPRSDLLRRYGYVQSDYARYDVVELSTDTIISIAVEIQDHTLEERTARLNFLKEEGLQDTSYDIYLDEELATYFPIQLLGFVYTWSLEAHEFQSLARKRTFPKPARLKTAIVGLILRRVLQKKRWWRNPTRLLSTNDDRLLVDVELLVLPFSAQEERDAREWLSKSGWGKNYYCGMRCRRCRPLALLLLENGRRGTTWTN